jgi:methionine salvage enolase-phosphatase E1
MVPLILDNSENKQDLITSIIRNVIWQMDLDRKTKGLKQLQGHIWSFAYKNRLVTGQ